MWITNLQAYLQIYKTTTKIDEIDEMFLKLWKKEYRKMKTRAWSRRVSIETTSRRKKIRTDIGEYSPEHALPAAEQVKMKIFEMKATFDFFS